MKKVFLFGVLFFGVFLRAEAEIYLSSGDSVVLGRETIYCDARAYDTQYATARTCSSYYSHGPCASYDEVTYSGRFCAEGKVCKSYYSHGPCASYDTTASCGDRGCTTTRVCQKYYSHGPCASYDEQISCN